MTEQPPTSLIERGLHTFLHGFSATRGLTHPYPARQLTPSIWLLSDAPRAKGASRSSEVGETPVGWVRSVSTGSGPSAGSDSRWVANLFVRSDYRRRGIGRSLMSAMLNEDAALGASYSALLASKTGALLYPQLGYELHGHLLVLVPPKKRVSGVG